MRFPVSPQVQTFGLLFCLLDIYKDCPVRSSGTKEGTNHRDHQFAQIYIRNCVKKPGLHLFKCPCTRKLVCSIKTFSTKMFLIKPFRLKGIPLKGLTVLCGLIYKNFKRLQLNMKQFFIEDLNKKSSNYCLQVKSSQSQVRTFFELTSQLSWQNSTANPDVPI